MRILRQAALVFLLPLVLTAEVVRPERPGSDHVVLISIDGFAAFHLDDSTLQLPNLRALTKEGTRAKGSQTVFPSVTHPSHTSLLTGVRPFRHGVLNNRMRHRETGNEFHITNLPRSESIHVPTLFDLAKSQGLITGSFFWPETREDTSIDFNLAEVFDDQNLADRTAVDPGLLAELRQAGVPIDLYFDGYGSEHLRPAGDIILASAAAHILEKYKPNLLTIHLLATDVMQHNHGPEHYLARNAFTVADHCVGLLREAAERAGIRESTTFIVTGDHGFHSVGKNLNLHPALRQSGLEGKVSLHPEGWHAFLELTSEFREENDRASLEMFLRQVLQLEGISRVFGPGEFRELGLPEYVESPFVPGQYLVFADIDYHLVDDASRPDAGPFIRDRTYHGHGYLPEHPRMKTAFVASGNRIRKGAEIDEIRHVDVAPTIARLLGLEMPDVEGRVLEELLQNGYEVLRTRTPLVIDGRLDDRVWQSIPEVGPFKNNRDGSPSDLRTEAKITYDDQFLYFAFKCWDRNIWSTFKNRDEHLWTEEVVEVFLRAEPTQSSYIELEVNPLGTLLDIFLLDIRKPLPYDSWNSRSIQWAVQVSGTVDGQEGDQYWTCEIALPLADVVPAPSIPPRAGDRWLMNLYRVEKLPDPAGLAWSPTRRPDFHVPSRFGEIIFSERSVP